MSRADSNQNRYGNVAVLLHWLIALFIIANVIIGLDFPHPEPGNPFPTKPLLPLHISLGLSVLVLSVLRLLWRLAHKPPPHPPTMKRWEIRLAGLTHIVFYALILAMPLTGWAILSAWVIPRPLSVFGIPVPALPINGGLNEQQLTVLHDQIVVVHELLTLYVLEGLLLLHVGAVIKHHLFDKDPTLKRMLPRFGRFRS
jgi:cytochrome b561